ncbi:MAG TPA: BatA domain-containing protein [Bryobacteraceae bacterium]|nr:BatA domain-containing protein [Bryobacteraceae bacterium]
MGFLAPWFLAGVAAVGLPLYIHLLRQYRSTPHPFSSLMFFEKRVQSSVKHRRLRYLLLLSLRVALLILMAIAFANPFVTRGAGAAGGRKLLVLAVDDSFSMHYGDHFSKAKDEAINAVSSLSPGDRGQALALDSQVHFLTQQTEDPEQMRNAIRALQPSDARSSYAELSRTLRTLSESAHRPMEVHFFTDAQKSSMAPSFTDMRLGSDTNLIVHSVASDHEPNWTVESVSAPGRIYNPKKVKVQAVIAGFNTPAAQKTVSLVLDGKVLESKQVSVPEGGRANVEFVSLDSSYGFHKAEVRVDSGDQFRNDDRFPFAIERADPNRILFLHQTGNTRDLLYFQTALESATEAGFLVEPLAIEQAGNQSFSKYPFVVLSDVGPLPSGMEDSLRAYVNAGGSLLISLGPASAASHTVPVFGEAILESRYSSREGDRFQTVSSIDPEYPPVHSANKLDGVQFFQTIRVEPGKSRVIARLTDQTPLLLEKRIGDGRVVVFASTFDNISNDFPLHASFLPFIEQTARYLGGQQERSANLAVDSYVELRSAKDQGAAANVIDPDGKHPLSLKEASTAQNFKVTREGFYEIHQANGHQGLVAVHADRGESDLTVIPKDTIELWRNTGRGTSGETAAEGDESRGRPWSLWRYALFVVLLIAITESLVGARYLSVDKEAA